MSTDLLLIDDRSDACLTSCLGTRWRAVSDTVMGGASQARLAVAAVAGRPCACLHGEVSLENNGGFVQASLDLAVDGYLDASAFGGFELDVYGNGETYNLHLRTADTRIVWQSYRASFVALPQWQTLRLPFSDFQPYRIDTALNLSSLRRIGIVGIGRAFTAEVCVARVALYRQGTVY